MAFSDSHSKHFTTSFGSRECVDRVLSSAKLCISAFLNISTKSLINMLNRIYPSIEPCGTPTNISRNMLNLPFIFSDCFLSFKFPRFKSEYLEMLSNLGQRRSKYGSNFGQNYIFGNSFTNHGHFELKLGHYLYLHGIHQKIRTFFQILLYRTKFGPKNAKYW